MLIPKELNSKIKIAKFLHFKEFTILIVGMGVTFIFDGLVAPQLEIPYYIFSFLAIGFLVMPARHNIGKDNYEAIYYTIVKQRNTFHSISILETQKVREYNENETIENKDADITEEEIARSSDDEKIEIDNTCDDENDSVVEEEDRYNVKKGTIVLYDFKKKFKRNKLFYVKDINNNSIEAYEVLSFEDISVLKINNAMNLEEIEDSIINLDKPYTLSKSNIIQVQYRLHKELINKINDNIRLLKEHGEIAI